MMNEKHTISLGHLLPDMLGMDAEQRHAVLWEFLETVTAEIKAIKPDAEIEVSFMGREPEVVE